MTQPTEPPCRHAAGQPLHRRRLLEWLTYGLGSLATLAVGVPILGYLLNAALRLRPDDWLDLGPAKQFPLGETRPVSFRYPKVQPWYGATAETSAFVRRTGEKDFLVLSVFCAHLGCPVAWFPQSGLFLCPCHGGVYYEDGARASGPPPRGLYRYPWEVRADGHLWVQAGHLPTLQDPLTPEAKS